MDLAPDTLAGLEPESARALARDYRALADKLDSHATIQDRRAAMRADNATALERHQARMADAGGLMLRLTDGGMPYTDARIQAAHAAGLSPVFMDLAWKSARKRQRETRRIARDAKIMRLVRERPRLTNLEIATRVFCCRDTVCRVIATARDRDELFPKRGAATR